MNEEFDILSFTADQLNVNQPQDEVRHGGNPNIYKTRPADAKSTDGIYRAQIKVIWNPYDLKGSVLEQQAYYLQDANGGFSVISALTNGDRNCPIFKAWKQCRYSTNPVLNNQQVSKADGGKGLFDKRFSRYVTIQVLDDPNKPELNGKYMIWKLPKAVWEEITKKQSPTNPAKASIPVMDFLFGRAIDIEVIPGEGEPGSEKYNRDTRYSCEVVDEVVSCLNPDLSPILSTDEQEILDKYVEAMQNVWRQKDPGLRGEMMKEIDADENTKALKRLYRGVIEKIKSYCPNLNDEVGYTGWSPEVTTRVQNWINIVLSGKDPKDEVLGQPKEVSTPSMETLNAVDTETSSDDDLPF